MAITTGDCPSCGSTIEFRAGASVALVCPYCKHVVVRSDRGFENLGLVADVTFGDVGLAPGDTGTFFHRSFTVLGRVVFDHPMGGTWEEYYAIFDGRFAGWIAEAQGRWSVVQQVEVEVPSWDSLEVGQSITLGSYGSFVVGEKSEGTLSSAEGELPFGAAPGSKRRFVDLSSDDHRWATFDLSEEAAPKAYVGRSCTLAELNVSPRAGDRPVHEVHTTDVKCPKCGAPIPLVTPDKSEHVGCPFCGALSDLATHHVLLAEQTARGTPKIPLGSVHELRGVSWTVLGYVERSGSIEGERFHWSEYLLYDPSSGYRWLVEDEGVWWFGEPIDAGAVDLTTSPRYDDRYFTLRNRNQAFVDYVLGEFYWKIQVGESVQATDYESGNRLLSSEESSTEINWTYSRKISPADMAASFGVARASWSSSSDGGSSSGNKVPPWIVVMLFAGVFVLFVVVVANGGCQGGAGGGSWGGGSGGK